MAGDIQVSRKRPKMSRNRGNLSDILIFRKEHLSCEDIEAKLGYVSEKSSPATPLPPLNRVAPVF